MTEIPSNDEPLPCPFCGGTVLKSGGDDKVVGFWCLTCEASGPNHYGSHEWNDRSTLPIAVEGKVPDELLSLIPDEIDIPPMTDRGVAGQVLDVAWPLCGGNHQDADFWNIFSFAVQLTLRVSSPGKEGGQEERQNYNCGCVHPSQCDRSCFGVQPASTALVEKACAAMNDVLRYNSAFSHLPGEIVESLRRAAAALSASQSASTSREGER